MDWSNSSVLEFIQLLQEEPCLWNPKNQKYRNRNLVQDAWVRLKNNFSVPCSIEELKKKKNTLLTQYRECLKKIKDSTIGADTEEIYQPAWFAFDALHSFLGVVYGRRLTLSTEVNESIEDSKRQRKSLSFVKKEVDETLSIIKNKCKENEKKPNECDLYGQLLSEKLKTLNEDDRLGLMNEIDNVVFKYIMNVRKRKSSSLITDSNQPVKFVEILNDDVSVDKKIKVISETVIPPPGKRYIIKEEYYRCSDDDD